MVQEEKTGGQEERKKGRKRNSRKHRRRAWHLIALAPYRLERRKTGLEKASWIF
jgi:hypothetical protein